MTNSDPLPTVAAEQLVRSFLKHETRDHDMYHFGRDEIEGLPGGVEAYVFVKVVLKHIEPDDGKLLEAVEGQTE